jgi:hypothetical protein
MAHEFEDGEAERLAAQIASLTGESKAEAMRQALRERLERLEREAVGKVGRPWQPKITPASQPLQRPAPPPRYTGKSASAFVLEEREDDR